MIRFSVIPQSLRTLGQLVALLVAASSAVAAQKPQPGDRLAIRIFGGEQVVEQALLVSSSGTVVLPMLGAVSIGDVDAATLSDTLRAMYAQRLRNPTVDVVLERRIIVLGEVRRPDIYYMDINATLPDVIAHAGGITEIGSSKKVSLKRGTVVTDIPDWESGKAEVSQLKSGDQIIVGRRSWLSQNLLTVATTAAVLLSIYTTVHR